MTATVNINGTITGEHQAVVSVFDHGFLYGEGVYEVLRTYGGRPFLLDRHLSRLRNSAAMIALDVPLTDEEFAGRIQDTIACAARTDAPGPSEWYIRILLTRGVGELSYDPASCATPSVVVIVKPHVDLPASVYADGVRVVFSSIVRNHPGTVNPLIKSNNLLNNALAMQEGFRRGAFEVIMRNYQGDLAECAQSNFFVVRQGQMVTPPLSAGLLAGVTRGFMWQVGSVAGLPVSEATLRDDDLYTADEAFLTGTTREIVPISDVEGRAIGLGRCGPVTKTALETFRRLAMSHSSLT